MTDYTIKTNSQLEMTEIARKNKLKNSTLFQAGLKKFKNQAKIKASKNKLKKF